MHETFVGYFRCPDSFARFESSTGSTTGERRGYFQFGPDLTLYGRSENISANFAAPLPATEAAVHNENGKWVLPFDVDEVATNLRLERYVPRATSSFWTRLRRSAYYAVRPLLKTSVRRYLQRASLQGWEQKTFPVWPVDRSVDEMFCRLMKLAVEASPDAAVPFIWFWPAHYASCAIMTHDVETATGLAFTRDLMAINATFDVPCSFQLIPAARYDVTTEVLSSLRAAGCEVNVHDYRHDGHLFEDRDTFLQAARSIQVLNSEFQAKGFRSGALYRNQQWNTELPFAYDMSVPNVAHLDPQPGGCCTVMPYFNGDLLELPVTATQDYSLFHILGTYSQDLWREQIKLVLQQHGLLSFIVHPDYLDTPSAQACYRELLAELCRLREEAGLWITLPQEVDRWWRERSAMHIVPDGTGWRVVGPGSERACLAYAVLQNGELGYVFP